jgi:aldehyde:ferredoxin oxidoreductase
MEIGSRIYNLERKILVSEGISRKDDYLPVRMQTPLKNGKSAGHAISKKNYNLMLDEYYQERGWDMNGIPIAECLKKLGID